MDRPIPAFYACYLLRSTVRHQSLYVGSTPHPVRRLRQHNGNAKGGAVRTSRDSLRPWEMTCLVTGFPSKIAALQFEWAWQNTHLSRHVAPDSKLTQVKSTTRISPKTGRTRTRTSRPRLGLTDRLANLHLLLRSTSFERWPLKVTFYAEDVYKVWTKWTSQQIEKLRPGIRVEMDESMRSTGESGAEETPGEASKPKGIDTLDVSYATVKGHLEKSRQAIENAEWLHCNICHQGLPSNGAMTLVCPSEGCSALSHLDCLSKHFLDTSNDRDTMLPTSGNCPECGNKLQWIDLVKELSLRMRGEKEIKAIFKKRRRTKKQMDAEASAANDMSELSAEDEPMEDLVPEDDDVWHQLPESSDVEELEAPKHATAFHSDPNAAVNRPTWTRKEPRTPDPEPVIEDSDADDWAVLT
ncbi:hypothetical protein D0865_00678 [Hortaea werneckii]|uniref:GIY-YIG domain-containing protein n=1 Tax=Hortaea werneckii TaxID=91943 RepID=A0A3M7DCN5_HORWE|nr:hypothetical protein D0865_00678 [Hortaea werneckii]